MKNTSNKIYNPSKSLLYKNAIDDFGCKISSSGALVAYSGDKTGRSPKDKLELYIVIKQRIFGGELLIFLYLKNYIIYIKMLPYRIYLMIKTRYILWMCMQIGINQIHLKFVFIVVILIMHYLCKIC